MQDPAGRPKSKDSPFTCKNVLVFICMETAEVAHIVPMLSKYRFFFFSYLDWNAENLLNVLINYKTKSKIKTNWSFLLKGSWCAILNLTRPANVKH